MQLNSMLTGRLSVMGNKLEDILIYEIYSLNPEI